MSPLSRRIASLILFAVTSILASADSNPLELPSSCTVAYIVHTQPTGSSPKRVEVRIDLIPQTRNQDEVAWKVDRIRVIESATTSTPARSWSITSPSLNTPDGLWRIVHAHPLKHDPAEFVESPLLSGAGNPESGTTQTLNLQITSTAFVGTPPSAFEIPASLALVGTAPGGTLPIVEVDDEEPTEIDDGDTQPTGNQ